MSVVLVPGRLWEEGDPMPSSATTYAKLLEQNGFEVRVGYCEAFEEGGEYGEKAAKAGEKKPDAHTRVVWVDALSDKHFARIAYAYVNERPPLCVLRMWDNKFEKISDADMKQRIKDASNLD